MKSSQKVTNSKLSKRLDHSSNFPTQGSQNSSAISQNEEVFKGRVIKLDWLNQAERAFTEGFSLAAELNIDTETALNYMWPCLGAAGADLDDPNWEEVVARARRNSGSSPLKIERITSCVPKQIVESPAEDTVYEKLVKDFGCPIHFNSSGKFKSINERFFAGLHSLEVLTIYDPTLGFYDYCVTTGLWLSRTEEEKSEMIARRMLEFDRQPEFDLIEPAINTRNLRAIVSQLRSICFREGAFDQNLRKNKFNDTQEAFVAHFRNGVLVLKEGKLELKSFSPDFYSRFQCPLDFCEGACAPKFLKMLENQFENREDQALFLRYAGQCLSGYNMTKRILILEGDQDSGKSTLMKLIGGIVGETNTSQLRTEHLSERFELNRYVGKPLLYGTDVADDFLSTQQAEKLKAMVGGDLLEAEAKHCNKGQQIRGNFNIIIGTNSRLSPPNDTHIGAWRTRLLCVSVAQKVPCLKIPDYDKVILQEEGPGIANLMLQGLLELRRDIAETGGYKLTGSQETRIDDLLAEAESILNFVKSRVERNESESLNSSALVEAYSEYCADKGWQPKANQIFWRELRKQMLSVHHVALTHSLPGGRGYRGVCLSAKYDCSSEL